MTSSTVMPAWARMSPNGAAGGPPTAVVPTFRPSGVMATSVPATVAPTTSVPDWRVSCPSGPRRTRAVDTTWPSRRGPIDSDSITLFASETTASPVASVLAVERTRPSVPAPSTASPTEATAAERRAALSAFRAKMPDPTSRDGTMG